MVDYSLPKILANINTQDDLLGIILPRVDDFTKVDAMAADALIKKSFFSRIS